MSMPTEMNSKSDVGWHLSIT